jgi:hypothetical protein
MNKFRPILLLLMTFVTAFVFQACDEDEKSSIAFETVASEYDEADGAGTVTIPIRTNGSVGSDAITFSVTGTAVEGEDFTIDSWSPEGGLVISIIDDNNLEEEEVARIQMVADGGVDVGGNQIHTLTITDSCPDSGNPFAEFFEGGYDAIEWYCGVGVTDGTCDYGPYHVEIARSDAANPDRFVLDNFYDQHLAGYLVFDLAAGTVHFPNQTQAGKALSASTGTFSFANCATTLTISLNYDGGTWDYQLTKVHD